MSDSLDQVSRDLTAERFGGRRNRIKRHPGCGRGIGAYHCRLDANQAALDAWQDGHNVSPALCEHCGLWHLTSKIDEEKTA